MKKKPLTKKEMVELLVNDDLNSAFMNHSEDARLWLKDIFTYGVQGYKHMHCDELRSLLIGRGFDDYKKV